MSQTQHEQFLGVLERAQKPVIVLSAQPHIDDFVSAYAMAELLKKLGKEVEIITTGGPAPSALSFLEVPAQVKGDFGSMRKLTITVKDGKGKLGELSYAMVDDTLQIHLQPKTGLWKPEDVEIKTDDYRYDLVMVIGAQRLEQCGALFAEYGDFFFKTPIIAIDHMADHDHFGQINLVDINAVSCSEVCYRVFNQLDESLIDAQVATFLLAGMIAKTKGFRSARTTPLTLKTAGELISRGARRDEIVQQLYKTRTVETLRLWGRALARLKSDRSLGLVWTMLTRADFVNAGAGEGALDSIIDELISTSSEAKVCAIFYEGKNGVQVILHAERPLDALALGAPFGASGGREQARLLVKDIDLVSAEKRVVEHLKSKLAEIIKS